MLALIKLLGILEIFKNKKINLFQTLEGNPDNLFVKMTYAHTFGLVIPLLGIYLTDILYICKMMDKQGYSV